MGWDLRPVGIGEVTGICGDHPKIEEAVSEWKGYCDTPEAKHEKEDEVENGCSAKSEKSIQYQGKYPKAWRLFVSIRK